MIEHRYQQKKIASSNNVERPRSVRKAFSAAASRYDAHASLQQDVGETLLSFVPREVVFKNILDVGMGTGQLTAQLVEKFSSSYVVGVDPAYGMIEQAQKNGQMFSMVQGDAAALPFKAELFDMIFSNLAYQWVEDLSTAFSSCYQRLRRPGFLCLSVFTHKTLDELFQSLVATQPKGRLQNTPAIQRLPAKEDIVCAVEQAGFQLLKVERQLCSQTFSDMVMVLRWLKNIGANALNPRMFLGPQWLQNANSYYCDHFYNGQGVQASFEVVYIIAMKS